MKKKYIIPSEILKNNWLYKENTLTTDEVNNYLITLRKFNLGFTKEDKKLTFKLIHFNKVVKQQIKDKEIDSIVNIIKAYLKEDTVFNR